MGLTCLVLALALDVGGQVTNAVTDQPLGGVMVTIVGGTDTTYTDPNGRFRLPATGSVRVRFAKAGFAVTELVAVEDTLIRVGLVPTARVLEATTVTAVRGEPSAASPRATLDAAAIEQRYFGQELPLLLTAAPSITAYSDAGSYSGYSYLRLRGIDQSRVNISIDGIPLNDPEDHFVYFSNFPDFANSLESVELQRGVGTSTNGVASYAGALTMESVSLVAARRRGDVRLGLGSYGSSRVSAEYQSGLLPSRFSWYARASAQRSDGYRYHSENRSESFFASAGYFGDRDIVKVVGFGGRARNGLSYLAASAAEIASDPRANPLSESERDDFFQSFGSVQYTRLLSAQATAGITAYGMWSDGDYDVSVAPDLWNFNLASGAGGVIGTVSGRVGMARFVGGVHANRYRRSHFAKVRPDLATRLYDNTGHKAEASAFVKATADAGPLTLLGDIQVRRARFRYVPDAFAAIGEQEVDWTFVNPKVGVTWSASRTVAVYASYGRNGREPTRNDLFAGFDNLDTTNVEFVGRLDRVRPESVRDLEAGISIRRPRLAAQANVYAMEFREEIAPIGPLSYLGLPLRKNVGRSSRRGVEVDIAVQPTERLTGSLNATASRNRIRTYTDDATGVTYTDVEPLLTPRLIVNPSLRYAVTSGLRVSVDGHYVGRSFLANTGDPAFVTPGRGMLDASVAWSAGRYALTARANNVTSARFYSGGYTDGAAAYYYVVPPRNYLVTLSVGL